MISFEMLQQINVEFFVCNVLAFVLYLTGILFLVSSLHPVQHI